MDHRTAADASTPRGGPAPDPLRWRALALLGTGFFMVILDSTIVLTALPSMQAELGMPVEVVQWVLTGYALTFGGLMLLGGRVADVLGRRRVLMAGVALFGLSSLLCGLAWSPAVLLAARAVQGASAAVMAPSALALVMTTFPEGPERNKALAVWGGLGGVGATAGLLVGGVVTTSLGWDTSFHLGNAIFIAISTSVALSVATAVHLATPGVEPLAAQTDGLRAAFVVTVITATLSLVAALTLFPKRTPR
jgi:MFS family permease